MINYCYAEYEENVATDPDWTTKNPDWNKVVLIPVTTTTDNIGNIVGLTHDLKMSSVKLRGGETNIAIKVVKSRFNEEW